ncbi:LysR family transcriptional regulator, partial [Achromobacter xylosoxidans]
LWLIQRHSARLSLAADAFLADLEKTLRAREAAPDPTRYDEDAAEP